MAPNPAFDFDEFRASLDRDRPVFDPDSFLARIDDDRELFIDLLLMVKRNLPDQFELARKALERDDMEELRLLSHRIKGSADNVSALRVRYVAHRIEREVLESKREHLKKLFGLLDEKIAEFRRSVDEEPPG